MALLSYEPENVGALYRLASSFLAVGLVEEAQRVLTKAEHGDSDSVQSHFYRGSFFLRLNKLEEALKEYNLGIERIRAMLGPIGIVH